MKILNYEDKYNVPISELVPKNDEQKACIEALYEFLPWDKVVHYWGLYYEYNSASHDPIPDWYDRIGNHAECKKKWQDGKKMTLETLSSPPWCFFFIGSVGNGKTTLACGLINEIKKRCIYSVKTMYTTLFDLVDSFMGDKSRVDYGSPDLLVIDEISLLHYTEYSQKVFQSVINERYTNDKKTILIGNINPEDFKKLFEPHVISRLKEGYSFQMKAPDMRKKFAWEV